MASTKLTRSYGSGVTGNRSKWTFSGWVKKASTGSEQTIMSVYSNSSYYTDIGFTNEDQINFFDLYNGGINGRVRTLSKMRDCNGWTHIVCVFDRNNATSGDKIRLWVNGIRITGSLASQESMPSNATTLNSDDQTLTIGAKNNASYFDGEMSHLHFCDGYAYDASYFGSTDSTTGEWKINTSPSVTYGTQGWFWLKDNNATTDNSSNSNTFTVGNGTLTKTEDNPSNVFATMNFLNVPTSNLPTFSNGNTTTVSSTNGSGRFGGSSTLGIVSGKFYIEAKATVDSQYSRNVIGISGDANTLARNNASFFGSDQESSGWYSENGVINYNNSAQYTAATYTTGDIIQIAIDLDNNRLFYGKNGTWQNSGNPTTSTGAITLNGASACNDGAYFICQADDTGTSAVSKFEFNFGNGYFGTTAVSSAGTNASNNGIFEYDVPSGYTALSTKGLNL